MTIEEILFFVQLLAVVGIVIYELLNVMNQGENYALKGTIMLMVGFLIAYFVGQTLVLLNPENLLYVTLMKLETGFLVLHSILFVASIVFFLRDSSLILTKKGRYIPENNYRKM
jgi:hypothetical protein